MRALFGLCVLLRLSKAIKNLGGEAAVLQTTRLAIHGFGGVCGLQRIAL
jgi:hypothetical protein